MFYLYPAVSGRSSVLACHKPVGLELWHRPSQVRSLACGLPSILEAHTPADLKHKPWVTPSRFLRQRGTVGHPSATPHWELPLLGSDPKTDISQIQRRRRRRQPNNTRPAVATTRPSLSAEPRMFAYMTPSLCGIRGPGRIGRCCYGRVMLEPTAARIQLETDRQKRLLLANVCLRKYFVQT